MSDGHKIMTNSVVRNVSGMGGEREKELEEKLKAEHSNYELLHGKYNLLEQTMKEEREELVTLRRDLHLAQQQISSGDMTSISADIQEAVSCGIMICVLRESFSVLCNIRCQLMVLLYIETRKCSYS